MYWHKLIVAPEVYVVQSEILVYVGLLEIVVHWVQVIVGLLVIVVQQEIRVIVVYSVYVVL